MAVVLAPARAVDVPALAKLILTHGPNAWNWLPAEGVQAHLLDIAAGRAQAVLAWHGPQLVGAATYCLTDQFRRYQAGDRADAQHGYVCEVVVAPEHAGRGLGSRLLWEVNASLAALGVREIYIDRHEEKRGVRRHDAQGRLRGNRDLRRAGAPPAWQRPHDGVPAYLSALKLLKVRVCTRRRS